MILKKNVNNMNKMNNMNNMNKMNNLNNMNNINNKNNMTNMINKNSLKMHMKRRFIKECIMILRILFILKRLIRL